MRTLRLRHHPVSMGVLAALVLSSASAVWPQTDLENTLRQYSKDTVGGYIQPIADLFGTNMQAGFYHSASIPRVGVHVEFNLIGMGSLVGEDLETYEAKTPAGFSPSAFETATVFGGKGTEVTDQANPQLKYRGSDGILKASLFPLAVPQLRVGSFMGTEAIVRFMTTPDLGDDAFPKTTLLGVGVRHSISQYLLAAPVDLAAGVFVNRFTAGDLIDFKGWAVGAQASKGFGLFNLYGGADWESTTMNLKYESKDPFAEPLVDIDLKGANGLRLTLGGGMSLGVFKLFADVNLGSITNFSGGIGLGI
jgi:hypothetical protein